MPRINALVCAVVGSASSSVGPALAPAQGKADSEALVVVTFNVGARRNDSRGSRKQRRRFTSKLSDDIRGMLSQGAEVINLQEISYFGKEQVLATMLPPGWLHTYSPTMTLLTLFAPTLELVQEQEVPVFECAASKTTKARLVLNTQLRRPCPSAGHIWSIWNNYTISRRPWRIQGDAKVYPVDVL